jgi:hypothetical protein
MPAVPELVAQRHRCSGWGAGLRGPGAITLPYLPPLATDGVEGIVAQRIAESLGGQGFAIVSFRHEVAATKL